MNTGGQAKRPELSAWYYSSGQPIVFTGASGRTKTLVSADGRIVGFPGIEAWTEARVRGRLGAKAPSPFVRYDLRFERDRDDGFTLHWTVQPDGRYWADEDGFGMTDDVEIVLFAHIDRDGCFTGPFRLHSMGVRDYYYGPDGLAPRPWFAYEVKNGLRGAYSISVARFCENVEELIIPESVKGHPVEEIQMIAFFGCGGLRRLTLPDTITHIGAQAFENCEKLEWIRMPARLGDRNLSADMFRNCSALTSVTVPEGVEGIGREAFSGCERLEELILPQGVRNYGPSFVRGCANLRRVTLPAGIGLITPFSVDGSPLASFMDEIRACAESGRAFVLGERRDGPADGPSDSLAHDRSVGPGDAAYALGKSFILDNRDRGLRFLARDSGKDRHVFQDVASGERLIFVGIGTGAADAPDALTVHRMLNRLRDIGLAQVSWKDDVKQIDGIAYGTCEAIMSREARQRAAVAACGGCALFIVGNVDLAIQCLRPAR